MGGREGPHTTLSAGRRLVPTHSSWTACAFLATRASVRRLFAQPHVLSGRLFGQVLAGNPFGSVLCSGGRLCPFLHRAGPHLASQIFSDLKQNTSGPSLRKRVRQHSLCRERRDRAQSPFLAAASSRSQPGSGARALRPLSPALVLPASAKPQPPRMKFEFSSSPPVKKFPSVRSHSSTVSRALQWPTRANSSQQVPLTVPPRCEALPQSALPARTPCHHIFSPFPLCRSMYI